MNIFCKITKPYMSNALRRIEDGIRATMPDSYVWVTSEREADVIIAPVVDIKDATGVNNRTVLMQLCYLTGAADVHAWRNVWAKAGIVASYLKLPLTDYIRMPLGFDPNLFYPRPEQPKLYRAVVTGYVDWEDGGEVIAGVHQAFGNVIHVGKNFNLGAGYAHAEGVSDHQMAAIYASADYVVALRAVEGFELPLIEGAACGATPIALDLECYRHWFTGYALFVDPDYIEQGLSEINTSNIKLMQRDMTPFNWEKVMRSFWHEIETVYE